MREIIFMVLYCVHIQMPTKWGPLGHKNDGPSVISYFVNHFGS